MQGLNLSRNQMSELNPTSMSPNTVSDRNRPIFDLRRVSKCGTLTQRHVHHIFRSRQNVQKLGNWKSRMWVMENEGGKADPLTPSTLHFLLRDSMGTNTPASIPSPGKASCRLRFRRWSFKSGNFAVLRPKATTRCIHTNVTSTVCKERCTLSRLTHFLHHISTPSIHTMTTNLILRRPRRYPRQLNHRLKIPRWKHYRDPYYFLRAVAFIEESHSGERASRCKLQPSADAEMSWSNSWDTV